MREKLQRYLEKGFSILLIGERGIGKSNLVKQLKVPKEKDSEKSIIVEVDCGSFGNDDLARSELFGYQKGAFTGANKDHNGFFQEANNGILFLDEIHNLSKSVQATLMKAIQTDDENKMSIRKTGSSKEEKVECSLIFATNRSISVLHDCLLPDFYDRIVQFVIEIPPLRKQKTTIKEHWIKIWEDLKFKKPAPTSEELIQWLSILPLYGNFRDLQRIAMNYSVLYDETKDNKEEIIEKEILTKVKQYYDQYIHLPSMDTKDNCYTVDFGCKKKEIQINFNYFLATKAIGKFGNKEHASEKLGVDPKTLENWLKVKSE